MSPATDQTHVRLISKSLVDDTSNFLYSTYTYIQQTYEGILFPQAMKQTSESFKKSIRSHPQPLDNEC